MLFNPDGVDLGKVLRSRAREILKILWTGEASTGDIVEATGLRREEVLRILAEFAEQGVVLAVEDYTMGSRRDIWSATVDESGFRRMVSGRIFASLLDDWPDEAVDELVKEARGRPASLSRLKKGFK